MLCTVPIVPLKPPNKVQIRDYLKNKRSGPRFYSTCNVLTSEYVAVDLRYILKGDEFFFAVPRSLCANSPLFFFRLSSLQHLCIGLSLYFFYSDRTAHAQANVVEHTEFRSFCCTTDLILVNVLNVCAAVLRRFRQGSFPVELRDKPSPCV